LGKLEMEFPHSVAVRNSMTSEKAGEREGDG